MYSLRYGTPPVVRATGGLADTVVDAGPATLADGSANGFVVGGDTAHDLWLALERAAACWRDRALWRRLQQNGMRRDLSWKHAARDYITLYRDAIARR
jgi:starch synthase